MVLMKSYIDLFLVSNQLLVAQDWAIYQYKIIISDELRWDIEEYQEEYFSGDLTKAGFSDLISDLLLQEFNSQNN